MAGATKISVRTVAALATVGAGFGLSRVDIGRLVLSTVTGPGSYSRIIALLVVLANFKNFPFVWHIRVLSAIFKHMEFRKPKFSPTGNGPSALFQPIISSSRSPITECDYNLHKSNSTYFSDLDVTRSNIMCCLMREGIRKLNITPGVVIGPDGVPATGHWGIMLGAVECSFKREIAPYEAYEMWSRILCWDRKWIYVVSYFVKKGAMKPAGYTISPPSSFLGSIFGSTKAKKSANTEPVTEDMNGNGVIPGPKVPHKAIFATAISKYVMKLGRLTVHPEVVMDASGLLPPRPGGWNTMSGTNPTGEIQANGQINDLPEANSSAGSNMNGAATAGDEEIWDWRRVEAENVKGMKFAEHFAALDGLYETFTGEDKPALGYYRDFL